MARKQDERRRFGRPNRNRGPFRRVVVATDFSRGAERAAERAARLPLAAGGKLLVVHIMPPAIPAKYRSDVEKEAREALKNVQQRLAVMARRAGSSKFSVDAALRSGTPWAEIVRLSRSEKADIIVLGRHGRHIIRDLLLGSTAERVIRKSHSPVLAVNRKPSGAYHRLVIALDLEDTARSMLQLALRVLPGEARGVSVVHGYAVPFEGVLAPRISPRELYAYRKWCREQASKGLQRILESVRGGIDWRASVEPGDPRRVILRKIRARRADLVVLGTHGRTGLSHALLGSVAEYVVRAATCDVLVAPPARFA